ncbi:hypothetical protein [Candidatus Nitrosotalea okcheonensis]|uniref:Uncharacterized protein n=1 Tax=Candidatus Nitrosotalea okcheonensis TaxID=1903276 RepID=A0A2H1FFM9_9ARCH|nr:hypothetical protein [Candidatus Nitrosotalea okcheonensis]MDE1832351.1 hypothetical protein [Nitrososphaerota archaeon]MDE2588474.1 hypothetical protein [Patescibacteria group bacterium]SMH71570.1 protein of unknown function [Candidatus Nitrosotalea okcheonensis]
MKIQYSRIIIIGIIVAAIVPMLSISDSVYNTMTSYELPQTPNITLHFNGSDFDRSPFNQFEIRQGQNMTLVLNVTSEPTNIPVTLSTLHHIGFTKTNGLDFQLSSTNVTTPNKVILYISSTKDATPNTYRTRVFASTLVNGSFTIGTDLRILVTNTTSTIGQIGKPWIIGMSSPLEQYRSGIKIHDIQCQPNYFTLIIKAENNSPACVKPDTTTILIKRGWAKAIQ